MAQLDLADEGLGAIFARLLRHRIQQVQPNRIVFAIGQRRRQIDDMGIGIVLAIAKLPDDILVVEAGQERMQAAREDDAG